MHDPWIERLSDYMDGLLSESAAHELNTHLERCAECRAVAAELRAVIDAAAAAPATAPDSDLWPGIAARLADDAAAVDAPHPAIADPAASTRVTPFRASAAAARASRRRFSFSMPQLAAAAVVLMAVSGAAVWSLTSRPASPAVASGTIIQSAGGPTQHARTVSTRIATPEYTEVVADLERALEQNRGQLDPATVEVIERSLEMINSAIADARSALAADPGNPYLYRQLDNTMRKKIDVLRRATGVQRAQS